MSYSALATLLRSTVAKLASLPQSVAAFLTADEPPLESVPEPYVPTTTTTTTPPSASADPDNGNEAVAATAAAVATATAAPGLRPPPEASPPSPPGPMPLTLRERATGGANPSLLGDPVSLKAEQSPLVPTPDEAGAPVSSSSVVAPPAHKELRREKAAKAAHGPDANPSMLGDPISMTSEAGGLRNPEVEEGAMGRRGSKL